MNTNTSATTVISLGAIGTILAYFGYQYATTDDDSLQVPNDEQSDSPKNNEKNIKIGQPDSKETVSVKLDELKPNVKTESAPEVKTEVKTEINEMKKEDKWSNYWEGEYKKQNIEQTDIVASFD
jgi:hypothetical protein